MIKKELERAGNKEQAKLLQRFFKTGKGEYGEGDIFLGIKVPAQREIARRYLNLDLRDIRELLDSKIHEHRLIALIILNDKFKKADEEKKKEIFEFYLDNTLNINNWDLVDLSAPNIIGEFLIEKNKEVLYNLAKSESLWERRIAVISTASFIKRNQFEDTIKISKILLKDKHDLIHKAAGWMLREVGKKDRSVLRKFLDENYKEMPRTMLRYAIEKFNEEERKKYLEKALKRT